MNIKKILEQLVNHRPLSHAQMQEVIFNIMSGKVSDVQIAAFLALMTMKGETIEELTAAALIMRDLAHPIDLGSSLIDIVGTGGDGKNTFNVSTASSFVAAAAGLKIAKHGNIASSSRSGSADLLLEAGFKLDLPDHALQQCMQQCHIAFLFAPHFHQAMQYAKNARQQLGIRSLFNLLGPILNPAGAKRQVVGVFAHQWLKPIAQVLAHLGSERALIINAQDGLDEISIAACTDVVEYQQGAYQHWTIDPREHGCFHPHLDDIVVSSKTQSLAMIEEVFAGKLGPARDIVLLNTAAALYCADDSQSYAQAVEKSREAIDSGKAKRCFEQLRQLTQRTQGENHE